MDARCPGCGAPLYHVEIEREIAIEVQNFGRATPRLAPVRICCEPPPTAERMDRRADAEWLTRPRRLAEE